MTRQLVLDPRRIETIDGVYQPEEALPPAVLKLGYVPNQDALQPGDLILTCPVDFHFVTAGITFVQKTGGYAEDHARWSHAAVYLGDRFLICEATGAGVGMASLLDYVPGSVLRIRRGVNVDRDTGWRIALGAMVRLRDRYDYRHAIELGRRAISSDGLHGVRTAGPASAGGDAAVICSELYKDAFWWATSVLLQSRTARETSPAFLSSTSQLSDVPCGWLRLP